MLKVQEIRELIKLVDASSIHEFVYEQDGTKIELKKITSNYIAPPAVVQAAPVEVQVQPPSKVEPVATLTPENKVQQESVTPENNSSPAQEDNLHSITSPMVGTFYASPSPDAEAYVKVGSTVSDDEIVCIVEAMKLFNEITAEVKGEIVEILVKDGQLVEYGQPLFLVKAE